MSKHLTQEWWKGILAENNNAFDQFNQWLNQWDGLKFIKRGDDGLLPNIYELPDFIQVGIIMAFVSDSGDKLVNIAAVPTKVKYYFNELEEELSGQSRKISIMMPTTDDWHPNYDVNKVKLTYHGMLTDGQYRVSCWGNDDFGIYKDFPTEDTARNMYNMLSKYTFINHQDLYDLSFKKF